MYWLRRLKVLQGGLHGLSGYEDASADLDVCPRCGGTHIDRLQRITGYLVGTTDRWNRAKLAELNDRVRHN